MLKLKLQYLGHLMQRADSLEKTPILGKIEGKRMKWLDGLNDSKGVSLSKLKGIMNDREAWVSKNWTQFSKQQSIQGLYKEVIW